MGTVRSAPPDYVTDGVYYPASDGKPLGETPPHVHNLLYVNYMLQRWLMMDPNAFVAGDMFVYYEQGNPRRHVSPDVFAVRGVRPNTPPRHRYLVWKEGKGPDFVLEVTSKSTRRVDLGTKMDLYRDTLRVSEYFLFDPLGQYLKPALQGYRLLRGSYVPIRPIKGRLSSRVLGLHLEADGEWLRLFDPATEAWLLSPPDQAEAADRLEGERDAAEARFHREAAERHRAEAEAARLRSELEELRRRLPPS
jgi:Uma2 family endonuclease